MRALAPLAIVPFVAACMSGGPGGTTSTTAAGDTAGQGSGTSSTTPEDESAGEDSSVVDAPDGIRFTIAGKTQTFAAQQQALPLESYVFLRTAADASSEYPWIGLRVYGNEKGAYGCVEGGTVLWYARSAKETYTSTSCSINIRKLGAEGEIVAGDFSGTLVRDYTAPDPDEPSTSPATGPETLAITRATFHMVARRPE